MSANRHSIRAPAEERWSCSRSSGLMSKTMVWIMAMGGSIGFQEMWGRWRSAGNRWQQIEGQGKNQVNHQHEHTDEPRGAAAVGHQ